MSWLDLTEAAKILGHKDTSALRHAIRDGKVPEDSRRKFGNAWAVLEGWVDYRRLTTQANEPDLELEDEDEVAN